ncbi:MAG TPA: adenosine kinase [Thermoanaerobaculia bacterium]|nr:adenosine kinase [Thermoanaerobaculia bacterium]
MASLRRGRRIGPAGGVHPPGKMRSPFVTPTLSARPIDVCGIENAILDLLVRTDDSTVASLGLHKGTMRLVETAEQARILEAVNGLDPEVEAGGSCANVLRVAALLGGVASYSSAVGLDANGAAFADALGRCGVRDHVARVEGRTGTSVILVTPDGERTMNTHLGVCRQYRPEHVPLEEIRSSKIFFTTGYIFDTPNQIRAIERALDVARGAGVRIALDLADRFVMERSRAHLERQLGLGIDLLLANAEESRALTGLDAPAAARELSRRVLIASVTDGANGAYIGSGGEVEHVPARRVEVVDTTGAGDCFNAGFLRGLVAGLPLRRCGELATLLAAETITHLGVKLGASTVEAARAIGREAQQH